MDFITHLEQQELQIAGQITEGTVGGIALLQLCMSASFRCDVRLKNPAQVEYFSLSQISRLAAGLTWLGH